RVSSSKTARAPARALAGVPGARAGGPPAGPVKAIAPDPAQPAAADPEESRTAIPLFRTTADESSRVPSSEGGEAVRGWDSGATVAPREPRSTRAWSTAGAWPVRVNDWPARGARRAGSGDAVIDEAPGQGGREVETLTGQGQVGGAPAADAAGQADGSAGPG